MARTLICTDIERMATIVRTPAGTYRAQVRRRGVSKSATFARKLDAQAWAAGMESAVGTTIGKITPPASMTLADVIDAYVEQVPIGRTAKFNLTRIKAIIGDTSIKNLSGVTMTKYVDMRLSEGITGATLAGDLSILSSALKWASTVKQLDIPANIAADARAGLTSRRISTRSKERDRIPTDDELARIYATLEDNPRQIIPVAQIARFAAISAMRLAEITGIQIENIRWNEGAVFLVARKHPTRKDRNDQLIPVPPEGMDILRQVVGDRSSGPVWPYDPRSVSTAWRRACKAARITPEVRFHDLRHLALTRLAALGLSTPLLRAVSGHTDLKSLSRYVNLSPNDFHKALNKARSQVD